jgi:hypothetical protein
LGGSTPFTISGPARCTKPCSAVQHIPH